MRVALVAPWLWEDAQGPAVEYLCTIRLNSVLDYLLSRVSTPARRRVYEEARKRAKRERGPPSTHIWTFTTFTKLFNKLPSFYDAFVVSAAHKRSGTQLLDPC